MPIFETAEKHPEIQHLLEFLSLNKKSGEDSIAYRDDILYSFTAGFLSYGVSSTEMEMVLDTALDEDSLLKDIVEELKKPQSTGI
ncbi:hypothetical protein AGMMS49949_00420 [Alphaproteobacteria bacterium]|nr:hypothetical protein AGMMS49949_00420 [Alphaproteobacteria bacterium]GHS95833.1 hypothetical protein AGMMS50296_1100 [Alphaproteobacteria bacterium]